MSSRTIRVEPFYAPWNELGVRDPDGSMSSQFVVVVVRDLLDCYELSILIMI